VAKFISVHQDDTGEEVVINVDQIVKFWRAPQVNYTMIQFVTAECGMTVRETPAEIGQKARS